jgi:predicted GNAT superfamily acetyltransferase
MTQIDTDNYKIKFIEFYLRQSASSAVNDSSFSIPGIRIPMDEMPITIRRAESPADYAACQEAQRRAWGLADEGYVVPVATMVGAQHHGGLVLGAFLPDATAVGLSFAFLGRVGQQWCLYSQLTGVVPGYQGRGLGAKIKEIQRDHARSIGLDFIAWSFDPLQAGNAHFNLHRLGASAGRYLENMYGFRTDALNLGVPTDRLIAEWPVTPGARSPIEGIGWPRLVEGPDEPKVEEFDPVAGSPILLVEIPADIRRIRSEDPARAERWRSTISKALAAAFEVSYRADDVVREEGRSFYVLRRGVVD